MNMRLKCRTKPAFVACLLAVAVAMPVWSDTLVMRDGRTLSGTLTRADVNTITFTDRRGGTFRYSVRDVDSIQFGDAPDSGGRSNDYNRPNDPYNRPDANNPPGAYNRPNSNNPPNAYNRSNGDNYDQAHVERVVLPVGTEVAIRTNERIDSKDVAEGQTFSAQIEADIRGNDGQIAIPRGSDAALITRRLEGNGDITLDIESITVEGRRYRVSTADQELENRRDNVGANQRTGKYVGGGAVLGAIIGAIAGGGKGAAIGAVAGAGAGAGAQIVTRGKEVHVPAETVLRFQLDRPLKLHLWS